MLTAPYSLVQQRRNRRIGPAGISLPSQARNCSSWTRSPLRRLYARYGISETEHDARAEHSTVMQ
jgi:hypothetical protein